MPDQSPEDNEKSMVEAFAYVKSGQTTYAVRDTEIDGKEIKEGNIMGLGDDGILAVGTEIEATTVDTVVAMADENSEMVSVYYGEDTTEEDANALAAKIEEALPEVEVEVYPGGQPVYYYIISVE